MKHLLLVLTAFLLSCGSSAPVVTEPPDLTGKQIVYVVEHPFQPERFEASGEWQTVVHMAAPIGLTGLWKQEGSQVCVEIEHSDWKRIANGEAICRDIQVRDRSLFIVPMTDIEEGRVFEITIERL